jgi:hypothetical protein
MEAASKRGASAETDSTRKPIPCGPSIVITGLPAGVLAEVDVVSPDWAVTGRGPAVVSTAVTATPAANS